MTHAQYFADRISTAGRQMHQAILPYDISSSVAAMDALHHEIFDSLDELPSVTNGEFINRYDAFVERIEHAVAT
jgi:hypothetical protein